MGIQTFKSGADSRGSTFSNPSRYFFAFVFLTVTQVTYAQTPTVYLRGDVPPSTHCLQAQEYPLKSCKIRISRTGGTTNSLKVYFGTSGSATLGVDYTLTPNANWVEIPIGEPFADVTVTPLNDAVVEPKELVALVLKGSPTNEYDTDGARLGEVFILDNDTVVEITTNTATAMEAGSKPGSFKVTRVGCSGACLAVSLDVKYTVSLSSTATAGSDYWSLTGNVRIPGTQNSAFISVKPIDDGVSEVDEKVTVVLSTNAAYTLSSDIKLRSATVTIQSNE